MPSLNRWNKHMIQAMFISYYFKFFNNCRLNTLSKLRNEECLIHVQTESRHFYICTCKQTTKPNSFPLILQDWCREKIHMQVKITSLVKCLWLVSNTCKESDKIQLFGPVLCRFLCAVNWKLFLYVTIVQRSINQNFSVELYICS